MMINYALLAIVAMVVVLMLFLRTNAAIGFFALCAGSVLVASSGDNVGLIASSLSSGNFSAASDISKIILLLLPFLVLTITLRGQVHKTMLPINLIPAICTALLAIIFIHPLLSKSLANSVSSTEFWDLLSQYKELVVGVGIVSSVVMISLTVRAPKDKHHKHGH